MNKILLIMPYFERPNMVLNALNSFSNIQYDNYEIVIIDDGSIKFPIHSVLKPEHYSKIKNLKLLYSHDNLENKFKRGSIHGKFMNQAIRDSNADIVVMMSDDDAVLSDYFNKLDQYYSNNKDIFYSYCHVIPFDPFLQKPSIELLNSTRSFWNTNATTFLNHHEPLNPYCRVDSTQVSWRRECNVDKNIFFPEEQTKNLDAAFYSQMFQNYGNCCYNGITGVYKGFHIGQLGNRNGYEQFNPLDITNGEQV